VHPLAPSLPVLHDRVNGWYAANARPLPWRLPGTSAWAVLVSEVMSHQTPVARVEPVWRDWLARWPTPADLAEAFGAARCARLIGARGYKERRATMRATPEADALRPPARTQVDGLFLAGDWTATELPPTIESAALSGHRAAEALS
jgi:A/G-specific adenine glycosylase